MPARLRQLLVLAAIAVAVRATCTRCGGRDHEELRIATFNIEDFPKDARQVDGAFAELAGTRASLVAVQEIGDAALLERAARERLGATWRFVHAPTGSRAHDLGLLYDSARWTLVSATIHDETALGGRQKPTLEAVVEHGGRALHVFVVHLKSGGENQAIRARQLAALEPVLRASGRPLVVLGDFNATGDADRRDIAALAREADLVWASEPLACSAFWDRDDGCPSSRLDHVLASEPATAIEARGACARDGCEWHASCPLYTEQVSDHCPVVATFE